MVGDGKKFLSALIVLDGDGGAEKWANENNIEYDIESMSKNKKFLLKFKHTLINQTVK